MEQSEDISDLLADVPPLTEAELAALAEGDLAAEAGQAPAGRKTAGDATGVGHGQRLLTRARRHVTYDLRNVPNAVALVKPLPRPGEVIHAIMGGDFACWDLVPAILDLAAAPAEELYIATLGFNAQNSWHLCQLLDQGAIRSAHILASDYFSKADASTFREAKAQLTARGATLTSTRNHAKIIGIAFERDAYVIEASANMRSCNNLEQIALTNDRSLFEFHRRWIQSIL